jgi:hypothetical protein
MVNAFIIERSLVAFVWLYGGVLGSGSTPAGNTM